MWAACTEPGCRTQLGTQPETRIWVVFPTCGIGTCPKADPKRVLFRRRVHELESGVLLKRCAESGSEMDQESERFLDYPFGLPKSLLFR